MGGEHCNMNLGKVLRGLTFVSSVIVIGCSEDVDHDTYYEDRHVHRHHDVDQTDVRVTVDDQGDRDQHFAPQAPPPQEQPAPAVREDTSAVSYDSGDVHADAEVETDADYDGGDDATYFQNDLQPYGDWVVTADFGHCFHPHGLAVGWRPYSEGHWVYTSDGWLWASDEPFGWACYHYGRWCQDGRYGWCWVPGRTWAPAWVAWRHGGGCAGWAPLPPRRHGDVSVSIAVEVGHIHPDNYVFVDERYIDAPHVHDHARPIQQNVTIINQTTNITNITTVNNKVVNHGVDPAEVEKASGHKIKKVDVVQTTTKGPTRDNGDSVSVFKKNIPPKKKAPVVTDTSSKNTAHTLDTTDATPKNKKTTHTDAVPSGKKPVVDTDDAGPPKKKSTDKGHSDDPVKTDSNKTSKTDTGKTDTGKPDSGKTDTGKTDTGKSDKHSKPSPDDSKSDPKSDSGKPDSGKPDSGKPDPGKSDKHAKPDDSSSGSKGDDSKGGKPSGSSSDASKGGKNSGGDSSSGNKKKDPNSSSDSDH